MIKQGKIKKSIKGVGDNKSCNLVFLGDESCRIYNFMHPVAEKGEEIPQDDKPEKTFKLKPPWICYAEKVYPVQQVAHSGDEQDMSDLMRYQTFRPSMPLHSVNRHCPANQGECRGKIKGLEY